MAVRTWLTVVREPFSRLDVQSERNWLFSGPDGASEQIWVFWRPDGQSEQILTFEAHAYCSPNIFEEICKISSVHKSQIFENFHQALPPIFRGSCTTI
jgi:hypothetical protein